MFKPVRVVATIVFIASIIMVFVGAFVINSDVRFVTSSHTGHTDQPSGANRYCASVRVFSVLRFPFD